MPVSAALDWVRLSVATDTPLTQILPHHDAFRPREESPRPLPHYTRSIGFRGGGRVDWNPDRYDQRKQLSFTGADLRALELVGWNGSELVKHFMQHPDCRPSRIDLAIDITDEDADPQELHDHYRSGLIRTHVQTVTRLDQYRRNQPRAGVTINFGNRQSERMLRCYDKAAEQGVPGPWTRLELETKGPQAARAAAALQEQPLPTVAAGLTREYIKTQIPWFENALDACAAGQITADRPGRHQGEGEEWKRKVVAPAFIRGLDAGESWAWEAVLNWIAAEGSKLTQS